LLDTSVRAKQFDLGLLTKKDGGVYHSFDEMIKGAKHLDHFHVYEKRGHKDQLALDFHTDQGLFIGIVPSIRISEHNLNKEEDSFMVKLKDNIVAQVRLPENGDVVVFMIGDGSNYLNPHSHYGMRAVPHALHLEASPDKTLRAWFGRMFFAPNDAILTEDMTFQSIIDTVVKARRLNLEIPSFGCSKTGNIDDRRVLQDHTGNNCSAGTAYCWMGCRSTANLTCEDSEAICQTASGDIWQDCDMCHDGTAKLVCPTAAPSAFNFSGTTLAPTSSGSIKTGGMFFISFVLAVFGGVLIA
jgi:hypothetical protein